MHEVGCKLDHSCDHWFQMRQKGNNLIIDFRSILLRNDLVGSKWPRIKGIPTPIQLNRQMIDKWLLKPISAKSPPLNQTKKKRDYSKEIFRNKFSKQKIGPFEEEKGQGNHWDGTWRGLTLLVQKNEPFKSVFDELEIFRRGTNRFTWPESN